MLSALGRISDGKQRSAFLHRRNLFSEELAVELHAAAQKELRIDTAKAKSLAQTSISIARKLRKKALLAQGFRILGNVLAAEGTYQAAVDHYNSALRLFEKLSHSEGIARTLTAAIQPNIMLGAYDEAFRAAERAGQLFQNLGDVRRLARLQNNIGNIYHRQDRFDEALKHYERAYQELFPYGDAEEIVIALNNMSMCLISLNDFARAMSTYERAKERLSGKDLPLVQLITDYNIAYLYYMRGDYRRAIQILNKARIAGERIGYTYAIALCYLDLSDIYVELNLTTEALEAAEAGNELFQELQIGYEAAKTITNSAIALEQKGQRERSLELFERARTLFLKEKNAAWPRIIDLYKAVVLFHEGRYTEARGLAIEAARFFDTSGLKQKASLSHLLLARLAFESRNRVEAEAECTRALRFLETVEAPILRYQAHFLRGQIEQAEGKFRAAHDEYQQARAQMESLRSSLDRDELKISFMKNKVELYERLVELSLNPAFATASPTETFQYIELAKSRSFTELLAQRPQDTATEKSGQNRLDGRILELREELNWYRHRIELEELRPSINSRQTLLSLSAEAQKREKFLLKLLNEFSTQEAAESALAPQGYVPLEKIQSLLNEETALLEYFFAGDTILLATITKNALEIRPISSVSRVSQIVRLLRFQFEKLQSIPASATTTSKDMDPATFAHLQELYEELIGPVRWRLVHRHLVVVPHGILHYLPFHALHNGEKFLVDSYDVSYAPSSSLFALCQLPHDTPGSGALILGAPDERSPLIRDEVEALHKILPDSRLFIGDAATHDVFFREAPSSQIVHIAAHGVFRPDNPMFSGIRLGDSRLYLYELYRMRLTAELFALSGCATGLNVVATGDELLGLKRGLLYAGARSLLLSLWDVNDETTAQFMTAFYRHLSTTSDLAHAAGEAGKEIREAHPHPYYWAPFFIAGKGLMETSVNWNKISALTNFSKP